MQVWKPFFKNTFFEKHLRTTASVISKIIVNPKDNRFTITMELYYVFMPWQTPPQTKIKNLKNLFKISNILWGYSGWQLPKIIAKDKNTFSVALKALLLPELMSLWRTWRTRNSHPEVFCKKGAFKNFEKSQKNICAVVFFNKIQAGFLSLYYKETPVLAGFFLEILRNF